MKKTVIFVWTITPCNITPTDNYAFWGIGDIIRGIIAVNEICAKYDYEFYIDFQKHQIKHFLKENVHPFSSHVESTKNIPYIFPGKVEKYITECNENIVMLVTNEVFNKPIPLNMKTQLKNILTPNDTFQKEINVYISKLPKNYEILHFRLGDDKLVRNNDIYFENIINKLDNHFNENKVIVTDNMTLKQFLLKKEKYYNNILDTGMPCHIGIQTTLSSLKNTLIEFYIITRSSNIRSYSVYSWISGFVNIPSILYDIPLQKILV